MHVKCFRHASTPSQGEATGATIFRCPARRCQEALRPNRGDLLSHKSRRGMPKLCSSAYNLRCNGKEH